MEKMSKLDEMRLEKNFELLDMLAGLMIKNPMLRFGQILQAYEFVLTEAGPDETHWKNEFYLEPDKLLERVEKKLNG